MSAHLHTTAHNVGRRFQWVQVILKLQHIAVFPRLEAVSDMLRSWVRAVGLHNNHTDDLCVQYIISKKHDNLGEASHYETTQYPGTRPVLLKRVSAELSDSLSTYPSEHWKAGSRRVR